MMLYHSYCLVLGFSVYSAFLNSAFLNCIVNFTELPASDVIEL